ncbi:MAG: exodeoxyribonuclease V subunit gamma [Thermodesulfobacteriota bacterium]|nr:exodeoxyribonuclease V subunit gamma [Thermodesulfobacteriota bacterium]
MTIELYFSDQLEKLADKISHGIQHEDQYRVSIFQAPTVIVPNMNVKKWLQLFLAEKNSILMNIDFQYLESGLWSMLAAIDHRENIPEMLDHDRLKILMLHALRNLDGSEPDLLSITRYLFGKGGRDSHDYAAKLWQLSNKLAHLFQEYEYHRTEMIRNWHDEKITHDDMEHCQKQLYLTLKALKERISNRSNRRLLSMMEYADEVLSEFTLNTEKTANKKSVHFFGLSQISSFHLNLIGRLQTYYDTFIYVLNPCKEFWEDIRSPREKQWIRKRDCGNLKIHPDEREHGELFQQDDNALLALWGKPGREGVRLLCELTDYQFNACFSGEKSGKTVLQRIQNNILTLSSSTKKEERIDQDRSLQIIACPGIYREVETIYNSILFNLEQDKHLQLTDIAVLVPDMSIYKPVFDAVFNRTPRCLTYNLVDSHADMESAYGQAVLGILKLAGGRFSRRDVFSLILNPCFMTHWNIDHDEIQIWVAWADALHIFHSFDPEAKGAQGYPATNAYTWKQGLQRLRLSRILQTSNTESPDGFKHFQQHIPYTDLQTGDINLIEKFCMVIETLHDAATTLNMKGANCTQWRETFFNVCDQLIEIPADHKEDLSVQRALIHAFENLKIYDQLQDEQSYSGLELDFISEFIRSNLGSISGGHGNYLTDGITLSELQPMRPIPFDIVYVAGMEEGIFPGKANSSTLDLRLSKRRIGDINLPDRNRYLFLEMLLSVREKLYITYVSRDLQKDRLQQTCSVINQLRRYVEEEILPDGQPFQITEMPLQGSSECYLDPKAVNNRSDAMVNYSLADRLISYRANGLWKEFCERASVQDMKKAESFDPDLSFHSIKPVFSQPEVETITSRELRKFLEDPVRQYVQRHMDLYEEGETMEDLVLREDEPFFSEYPVDYSLKMDTIQKWLDAFFSSNTHIKVPDIGGIYDLIYEDYQRKSKTPEGDFAELDRVRLRNDISQTAKVLAPILEEMKTAKEIYRTIRIGQPIDEDIPSDNRLPVMQFAPLSFTMQKRNHTSDNISCEVRLHGHLPWLWKDHDEKWHALILTGSGKKPKGPDKYILEPVILYLSCLAGEESAKLIGRSGITFHLVYREKVQEFIFQFNKEYAVKYLTLLVSDYMSEKMPAWLPFDAVTGGSLKPHTIRDDKINDTVRNDFATELEDIRSEREEILTRLLKPKIPFESFDIARQRFRLFFQYS